VQSLVGLIQPSRKGIQQSILWQWIESLGVRPTFLPNLSFIAADVID